MTHLTRSTFQLHPFHLVSPSPWPLFTSISLLTLTTSGVLSMHGFSNGGYVFIIGFITVVASMAFWFRDVIAEGTAQNLFSLLWVILSNYTLNTAKAITQEEIKQTLLKFSLPFVLKKKHEAGGCRQKENGTKNDQFGHYLAGLLEGDGHISLPAVGYTTLNRVLNPRILFTSHNLGLYEATNLDLVSIVGCGQPTKEISSKTKISSYYYSIFIGLLLSDGWSYIPARHNNEINLNARIKFRQPYTNLEYILAVFNTISQYCDRYPYHYVGLRNGKRVHDVIIRTRCLPCFTELHSMFYSGKEKIVPQNIYDLLTPIALAHWVRGSGTELQGRGLKLCIGSFNNQSIAGVTLMNVLMIKYRLKCSLQLGEKKSWIYIYRSSMETLKRNIKQPYLISGLSYRVGLYSLPA
jgi:hypothetical protein